MIKSKDLTMLFISIFAAVILSFVASKILFSYNAVTTTVKSVPPISSTFPNTNSTIFQDRTIDPTVVIQINSNGNSSAFNGGH